MAEIEQDRDAIREDIKEGEDIKEEETLLREIKQLEAEAERLQLARVRRLALERGEGPPEEPGTLK